MNIFIRADADSYIGSGHVMRCLTLADELRRHTARVSFICRAEPGNLIAFLERKKYSVYILPSGIDPGTDAQLTQGFLKNYQENVDWIIVDHYRLDISYESALRIYGRAIMVIDDLADRPHDCNLLLDQNYHQNVGRYKHLIPDGCKCLLGPNYALLRPQFRECRKHMQRKYDDVRRLLVFLGGADPTNETCKVLRAIHLLRRPELEIDVVIGASNPHRQEIEAFASCMPSVKCHTHVENMANLMAKVDIGIGAAGTSTWERCCLGLPSIVMILADNQRDIAEDLDQENTVNNLGWYAMVTENDICQAMQKLIYDPRRREQMSTQSQALVDGEGTGRVVKSMITVHATLNMEDAAAL